MILNNNLITQPPAYLSSSQQLDSQIELSVSTNSRQLSQDSIFIALEGERFDGYDFITRELADKVYAIVYRSNKERDCELSELSARCNLIRVSDTLLYFQQLAEISLAYWRKNFAGKVFTITGSNGKTTNKDMLSYALESLFPQQVHATSKNFNNHIGVPLTIMDLKPSHRYLVLEIGTNHPGEIETLCNIIKPSSGYITNVGSSHLEFFHNIENVFKEKRVLFDFCQRAVDSQKIFIINSDDNWLSTLEKSGFCKLSGSAGSDYVVTTTNESVTIGCDRSEVTLLNPLLIGEHNYKNISLVFSLLDSSFPTRRDDIICALEQFPPQPNRSQLIKDSLQTIFLDAYNANPTSMQVALSSFANYVKKRDGLKETLIVVGDMNEMGTLAEVAHQQLGEYVEKIFLEQGATVIFVGRYGEYFKSAISLELLKQVTFYSDRDQLSGQWASIKPNYMFLFFKASRSLQLESLLGIK